MQRLILCFATVLFFLTLALAMPGTAFAADRPNIVWISCEDISPWHFSPYGGRAKTVNIQRLADEGVKFTHAFTNAGVCAPSRTGIITGMMPTTIGANHMRSRAMVPDFVKGFPYYLREAGYYTTNNVKTDYNIANFDPEGPGGWNESSKKAHWRNRKDKSQPFFAVFNFTNTHESQVFADEKRHEEKVKDLSPAERIDPRDVTVPPLYPDTPRTRRDQADLDELATVVDHLAGDILKQLEEDGLLDDTIIFFWSDHGDGLPRAKRWLYDTGTRVPLIVRIPEKFRTGGQGKPGSVSDRLLSGIDLGPTVLNLAGIKVPDHMEGRPFLGTNLPGAREYAYGARDRMDERYDLIRSVRDKRYRYIMNLLPWKPMNQSIAYSEQEWTMQELRRLQEEGKLPEGSGWFLVHPKPFEELYDLEKDPWELHNLAADPAYADELQRMREALRDWAIETRDTGIIPEAVMNELEQDLGSRYAIFHQPGGEERFKRVGTTAVMAASGKTTLRGDAESALPALRDALSDDDELVRYWAVQGGAFHAQKRAIPELVRMTSDPSPTVRVAAAHWLGLLGEDEAAMPVLLKELENDNGWVVLAALTALDEMGDDAKSALPAVKKLSEKKLDEYPGRVVERLLEKWGD